MPEQNRDPHVGLARTYQGKAARKIISLEAIEEMPTEERQIEQYDRTSC